MSHPPQRKVMSFMNSNATVRVGTWVVHCKDLKTKSNSMFQNGSDLEPMQHEHNPHDHNGMA